MGIGQIIKEKRTALKMTQNELAERRGVSQQSVTGWEEVTAKMAKQGKLFALKVRGNSMTPEFKEGDIVIVKEQPDVESGEIAVVLINGDEATVKEVKKSPEGLTLIGHNVAIYTPALLQPQGNRGPPRTNSGEGGGAAEEVLRERKSPAENLSGGNNNNDHGNIMKCRFGIAANFV